MGLWTLSRGLARSRENYYSPELGRFLQPDPIGHLGDAYNIYRYCGNDPVNNIDPSGLDWGDFSWGGGNFSYNLSGSSSWLDSYSSLSSSSYNSISSTSYSSGGISWYSGFGNDMSSLLYGGNSRSSSSSNGSNSAASASSNSGTSGGSALSVTRDVLDFVSFIPGANIPASIASAGISLYQGEYAAAGLAAVGVIPCGKLFTSGVKAANWTMGSYKGMRALTAGGKGAIHAHHILESRHLRNWLGREAAKEAIKNAPAVILHAEEHKIVTKALQDALPYGQSYSKQKVWAEYQNVYAEVPEWLEAIEPYFK